MKEVTQTFMLAAVAGTVLLEAQAFPDVDVTETRRVRIAGRVGGGSGLGDW